MCVTIFEGVLFIVKKHIIFSIWCVTRSFENNQEYFLFKKIWKFYRWCKLRYWHFFSNLNCCYFKFSSIFTCSKHICTFTYDKHVHVMDKIVDTKTLLIIQTNIVFRLSNLRCCKLTFFGRDNLYQYFYSLKRCKNNSKQSQIFENSFQPFLKEMIEKNSRKICKIHFRTSVWHAK